MTASAGLVRLASKIKPSCSFRPALNHRIKNLIFVLKYLKFFFWRAAPRYHTWTSTSMKVYEVQPAFLMK